MAPIGWPLQVDHYWRHPAVRNGTQLTRRANHWAAGITGQTGDGANCVAYITAPPRPRLDGNKQSCSAVEAVKTLLITNGQPTHKINKRPRFVVSGQMAMTAPLTALFAFVLKFETSDDSLILGCWCGRRSIGRCPRSGTGLRVR